ncbi:hypothetical protein ETAE_2005 [Edwardsiella piscicida]|uniref:Uncharacterized protein n=1 Tax=Edwardsiella piscicida TaxID=1263550 RepID=A0AAU8PSE8_EDWPI|nr:hypothetical protein ETAE_2005 [Edwardsiella tarda EIB202]
MEDVPSCGFYAKLRRLYFCDGRRAPRRREHEEIFVTVSERCSLTM